MLILWVKKNVNFVIVNLCIFLVKYKPRVILHHTMDYESFFLWYRFILFCVYI